MQIAHTVFTDCRDDSFGAKNCSGKNLTQTFDGPKVLNHLKEVHVLLTYLNQLQNCITRVSILNKSLHVQQCKHTIHVNTYT